MHNNVLCLPLIPSVSDKLCCPRLPLSHSYFFFFPFSVLCINSRKSFSPCCLLTLVVSGALQDWETHLSMANVLWRMATMGLCVGCVSTDFCGYSSRLQRIVLLQRIQHYSMRSVESFTLSFTKIIQIRVIRLIDIYICVCVYTNTCSKVCGH